MKTHRRTTEQGSPPLVSIGVPTYNRCERLRRTLVSVLTQTYENLEIVVSDDGSTDGTAAMCRDFERSDPRVRLLRTARNLGLTANYNRILNELRGDYVMLLSDDDWLAANYVEDCLSDLMSHPGYALVCGRATYYADSRLSHQGALLVLDQDSPRCRVRTYLTSVDENGLMYGLMSRHALRLARPFENCLGNDWLFVTSILLAGKARTIETTTISRDLGGSSGEFSRLACLLKLPPWQARLPHLVIAWNVVVHVLWGRPEFAGLRRRERLVMAMEGGLAAIRWRSLVWHLTAPALSALAKRPRGRRLWACYLSIARSAGAKR